MKNLKKMLALMVALVVALAFAGCEKKKSDGSSGAGNGAEGAVKNYMEALTDCDFEGAMDYVDNGADVYDALEEQAAGTGVSEMDKVMAAIMKDVMSVAEYEIVSSEVDGDTATVTVSTNISPNAEGSGDVFEEYDLEEMVANRQSEIINESYTYEQVSMMSQAEIEEIDMETAIQALEEVWDEVKDDILEEGKNAEMEEFQFELEKDGDDWVIVYIK